MTFDFLFGLFGGSSLYLTDEQFKPEIAKRILG